MKIHQLLRLKIVNIIAMIALLYFLFEQTKSNPRAITNQISGENLQKNLDSVSKKIPQLAEIKKMQEEAEKKPSESAQNNNQTTSPTPAN